MINVQVFSKFMGHETRKFSQDFMAFFFFTVKNRENTLNIDHEYPVKKA